MRPDDTTAPAASRRARPRPRRLGAVLAGLGAVGVPIWVVATRWSVVAAGNPGYRWLLGALAVAGLAMLAWSTRARRRHRRSGWNRAVRAVPAVLLVLVAAAVGWLRPFAATAPPPPTAVELADTVELRPAGPTTSGFVFYPGARVDPRAYLPLLAPLADAGVLVVVVKSPLGLAMLDPAQAGGVLDAHPEIGRWAVGGHSMGGVAAATYAAAGARTTGLVLWAAHPNADLSARTDLAVASISGTADGLTTVEDVAASRPLLPPGTRFVAVGGAVHADFGDYGAQPGDGVASIGHADAQQQIRAATLAAVTG